MPPNISVNITRTTRRKSECVYHHLLGFHVEGNQLVVHELLLAPGDMPVGQLPLVALLSLLVAGGHLHYLGQVGLVMGMVYDVHELA